ncbi:autotransporter domain-containing protein [Nitrospirillum sp. BR 11164]|uniref:autotransporter domain-containing protein n=1 Tax=Nitrospirillum sp. BR 11164 TaxID=3104324 RepID=UPI002AFFF695|nr:autotransporter domain-containing protein [Nitrospirillum sp. BR 11164]MEA1648691.1 autotransporter domain-containing protein [Nitrospirillum sp. BR 11164]
MVNNTGLAYGTLKGVDFWGGSSAETVINSGTIVGGYIGLEVPGGTLGTVTNTGLVTGRNYGIQVSQFGDAGTIGAVFNGGIVQGGYHGVDLSGTGIGSLVNTGTIKGDTTGIALSVDETYNYDPATQTVYSQPVLASIGLLSNAAGALIMGASGINIAGGSISTLVNAGQIVGTGQHGVGVMITNGYISSYDDIAQTFSSQAIASTIGNLTNSATGTISGHTGILAQGTIGMLSNTGLIQGGQTAIVNSGTIGTLSNSGTISGSVAAIRNSGILGAIVDTGVIAGNIINTGVIGGSAYGVTVGGTVDGIQNLAGGTISGNTTGILVARGSIGTLSNGGLIQGEQAGIANAGTIGSLVNAGTIEGNVTSLGGQGRGNGINLTGDQIYVYDPGAQTGYSRAVGPQIGTLANLPNALIAGVTGIRLEGGSIGTLLNDGQIVGLGWQGVVVTGKTESIYDAVSGITSTTVTPGSIGTLVNRMGATISGAVHGIQVSGATVETIANAGLIGGGGYGISLLTGYDGTTFAGGRVFSLANDLTGIISGFHSGIEIAGGHVGTLSNSGLIEGGEAGLQIAAALDLGTIITPPTIGSLVNNSTGTIAGNAAGIVLRGASVGTLINAGLIDGGGDGFNIESTAFGGYSTGLSPVVPILIGTLANLQGATIGGGYNGMSIYGATIGTLANAGVINGADRYGLDIVAGLFNDGATIVPAQINNLINSASGTISGALVGIALNGGNIGTLMNDGIISADFLGNGISIASFPFYLSDVNSNPTLSAVIPATIDKLSNNATGTISGPQNGISLSNATVGTLVNAGLIQGGQTGIANAGTIGVLSNSGTITGGLAALSITGTGTLGTLVNSGLIAGDVVNMSSRDLVIVGGSGDGFGRFTGFNGGAGTIINTLSNMVLAGDTIALGVDVNLGGHTLTNTGSATLRLDTIVNVAGNYAQGGSGALLIDVASTSIYGGLNVTGTAAISGGAIILNAGAGFDLEKDQTYTIVAAGDASSSYAGYTLVAPGHNVRASSVVVGGQTELVITVGGAVIGSGSSTTIGSGSTTTVDQVAGGTVDVTDGAPTIGTINSGSTVKVSGGQSTLNTIAGGSVSISGGSASVGEVSGGSVNLGAGGTIAGTQTVNVSGGSVAVAGMVMAPLAVSGGDVSIASGGIVNTSTPIQVSSGNLSIASGGVVASDKPVTVSGGSVNVSGVVAAPVQVTSGMASVSISIGGVVTQSVTASAGSVNVAGTITAPVTVSGGNVSVASGGTIVSSQPVQVTGGSLSISGNVNAPVQVSGTTVSASQIASATPVMTVDAGGTISQSVTVAAGKVSMNGTISGNVAIGSGGALRGAGVVTGQASVAGILAPGNSPGTLTFTNGLTQGAQSVLSIDIDGTGTGKGAGNYSRVLVTGGSYVIGSGAVLQPNLRGMTGSASNTYTPGLGTDFTIVQAAGGVTGTFAGITQPASGLLAGTRFTALYGSNAIDLYVTPTYGSLASLGASANQQTMGRVVAGLTGAGNADLGTVLKALYGLPTVGASLDALAQIGGSSQANIVAYSLNRGLAATQVLGQRLAAVRDGVAGGMQGTMQAQLVGRTLYTSMASGGDAPPVEDERGAAAGSAPEEGWHFWAQGLGAFTRVDSDGNAAGGHSNTGGGLFGGDRAVAPGVTLGLAGVLLQSTSGGANETSSYGLSAYGNVDLGDGLFVTGNAGYTYDQYDTARTMGFGGLSRTAFGHTTGDELSAGVTAGYRVRVSNLTLEPQAGIQWLKVGRDGFTETGAGALNLVLQDLDATALQSNVGGRASARWKTDGGTVITPAIRASWLHDFRDRALTSQAALAGTTFAVTGPDTGANALGIGGGLTLQEGNNLNLYANYDGTLRRHETDHVFTAGFRLSW